MAIVLSLQQLERQRKQQRRLAAGGKAHGDADAARFVDERGFVTLAPLARLALPSLTDVDARDPSPEYEISDGAWRWKETLPQKKLCVYCKFFQGRGTFIAWRLFPHFYVLYGPESDYMAEYDAGLLSRLERTILDIVADQGPLDSRRLWREVRRYAAGSRAEFEKALLTLQSRFHLTVSGGSLEGWSLHEWDLVERQVPPGTLARLPRLREAREALAWQAIENLVVCTPRNLATLFRWDAATTDEVVAALVQQSRVLDDVVVKEWRGRFLAVSSPMSHVSRQVT